MADNKAKRMNRAQEKAKSYIEEHNVEKIISEMLNSLVHARDPHPVIFMVLPSSFKSNRSNILLTKPLKKSLQSTTSQLVGLHLKKSLS